MQLTNVAEIKSSIYKAYDTLLTQEIMKTNIPLTHLSQETGISRTTLTKMRNGELGSTFNIKPFKKFKLFKCFFDVAELSGKYTSFQSILDTQNCWPSQTSPKDVYDVELSSSTAFADIFAKHASDPTAMAIYAHALGEGISQQHLKELFGLNGIKIAQELTDSKLLYLSRETYRVISNSYVDLPKEKIKKLVTSLSENYKSSHSGQGKNWINFKVDKTNKETIEKIQNLHADFSQKVHDLLTEDSAKGSIPFYTFNEMDTFEN